MWTFLSIVLSVAAMFVVATELLIREQIEPNHSYYKYRALFRTATALDVVFGDSHAAYGLTGLDGFVNLAYGGENLSSIAGKIRLYFADRQPGKIILQAGYHHFSREFLNRRQDETAAFRDFLNGKSPLLRIFEPVHAKELMRYWRIYLEMGKFEPKEKFMADGSRLSSAVYAQLSARHRSAAESRTLRILEPIAGFDETETAQTYRQIVEFLRAQGGSVCLVTFPAAGSLREGMLRNPRFKQVHEFFQRLARKTGARHLNLLDHPLPLDAFADPHHLNAAGARAVSRRVSEDCFPLPSSAAES